MTHELKFRVIMWDWDGGLKRSITAKLMDVIKYQITITFQFYPYKSNHNRTSTRNITITTKTRKVQIKLHMNRSQRQDEHKCLTATRCIYTSTEIGRIVYQGTRRI